MRLFISYLCTGFSLNNIYNTFSTCTSHSYFFPRSRWILTTEARIPVWVTSCHNSDICNLLIIFIKVPLTVAAYKYISGYLLINTMLLYKCKWKNTSCQCRAFRKQSRFCNIFSDLPDGQNMFHHHFFYHSCFIQTWLHLRQIKHCKICKQLPALPPSPPKLLTLKLATAMAAKTSEKLQHSTWHFPESWSHIFHSIHEDLSTCILDIYFHPTPAEK
jgi:hypothetical protein